MRGIYSWAGRDNLLFIAFHSIGDTIKRQRILRARRVNAAPAPAAAAAAQPSAALPGRPTTSLPPGPKNADATLRPPPPPDVSREILSEI